MGQCFLYGNGGVSGLQVVSGLTEPGNPRENMVWVKSDKAGRKYVFAASEPGSPAEGLIWFRATAAGIITRADVYTAGAWVTADTYMYLGGSWVQIASAWNGELFENGNLFSDYTGGWLAKSGTLSETDPYLKFSAGSQNIVASSGKMIDLTDFTQLHIIGRGRGDYSSGGGTSARVPDFGVAKTIGGSSVTYAAKASMTSGYIGDLATFTEEKVLDITSLSGEYYVAMSITGSHTGATLGVKKIWLT